MQEVQDAPLILLEDLTKHFRVLNRREGLGGAFRDLFSRNFRTVKAVDGVSLAIRQGEIVGFLGPNGAGKSTTIKMMTGVLEPTSGHLVIDGKNPSKQRMDYVRNIGVVFGQRTQLWWELPVIESFKLMKEIFRIPDDVYRANLARLDSLVNLSALYLQQVRNLSLGQRMLCDIAASFLHNPKIIFLDEPTIGLDVAVKAQIRTLIRTLNQERGTTILLTTHDIGDVEALCRRIILIDHGKTIYDGPTEHFTRIFGSWRTVKLLAKDGQKAALDAGLAAVGERFPGTRPEPLDGEESWSAVAVDQDRAAV
ncbi:MAG TPA: ATP-binding cassette domain-containing protein, partial [Spirochaetia bacterium]|nr:ATP-binding cassette domain-containing protein [Spirochaetia bacterium]